MSALCVSHAVITELLVMIAGDKRVGGEVKGEGGVRPVCESRSYYGVISDDCW